MDNIEEIEAGEEPALVIIGEEVAGMSATALAIAVRSNPLMQGVPLVIIAERFTDEDKQQVGALENVHFLEKPYDFDQLCEITEQYTAKWRLHIESIYYFRPMNNTTKEFAELKSFFASIKLPNEVHLSQAIKIVDVP